MTNILKNKFICITLLLFISLFVFSSKVLAWEEGGDEGSGNYSSASSCSASGCMLCYNASRPYGYRIYLAYADGSIIGSPVNVINNSTGYTFNLFNGNRTRKQVIASGGTTGLTSASGNYYTSLTFANFMADGVSGNFNQVFINQLNLVKDSSSANNYSFSSELTESQKESITDAFFSKIGLNKYYSAAQLASDSKAGKMVYLVAEPMAALYGVGINPVVGTATELAYWKTGIDVPVCQDRTIAQRLAGAATLTNYNGAGYYATSALTSPWSTAVSTLKNGNSKNGLIQGVSLLEWRVSDLFAKPTGVCPSTVDPAEYCSEDNYSACCDCKKASTSKYKDSDWIKNAYSSLDYPYCDANTTGSTCSYKLNVSVPDTCSSGSNSGYVKDSASWNCIFQSTSATNDSTVRNNYQVSSFSNRYCSVYCKEEVNFQMPGSGSYTYAGSYITVSSESGFKTVGPISYTGTSTCRVTNSAGSTSGTINVSQFVSDFNSADYSVQVAWDAWQYAELQNEVINSATAKTWSDTCKDSWQCKKTGTKTSTDPITGKITTTQYCAEDYTCSENRSGTYYTYNNKTYYGITSGYNGKNTGISDGKCSCGSKCGYSCTSREGLKDTASLKQAYINAVNYRDNLLAELKKCNNFYSTYNQFDPTVQLSYEDKLYSASVNLAGSGTATSSTTYYNTGTSNDTSASGGIKYSNSVASDASGESGSTNTDSTSVRGYSSAIAYHNCGYSVTKQACTNVTTYAYPTNSWYEQTTTRTYTYSLPAGLNNYVEKPSGYSVSTTNSTNYDYIPFSNLPIHYSTNPGNYDYSVKTLSYGNNDKFNKYIISSTPFNKITYSASTTYGCTYKVACSQTIVCTSNSCDSSCGTTNNDNNGGTDLIFRSISLYYPFPGQNATTTNLRQSGSNWQSEYNNYLINSYIYNNRGVKYYEVYNLDPMYEVELTPSLMRKIKAYNEQEENKTAYYYQGTSNEIEASLGYSDYTLVCKKTSDGSKSTQCTSSVIRDWGVTGCAIGESSGFNNCGTTVGWKENK